MSNFQKQFYQQEILFVDDDVEIIKSLRRQFMRLYNVNVASSAEEALKILKDKKIQVIISDQRMPGMNGSEFLSQVEKNNPDSIRILLTGFSDINAVIQAVNEGYIFRYVTEPWNPAELDTIVEEAFERYEMNVINHELLQEYQEKNSSLEERARITLSSIGDAVIVTDTHSLVTYINPIASQLMGYTSNQAIGQPLAEVFNIVNEHTREPVNNPVKRVLETGLVIGLADHTVLIAKDGTEYQISDSGAPIRDSAGKIDGVVLIFRNITEEHTINDALEASQVQFKTLLNTVPDLIWLKDKNGIYLTCNAKFEHMFGAKEHDIVGKTDYDFVDKKIADFFRYHDEKALIAGEATVNEELLIFADDGHSELVETIKTPMTDNQGNLIGILGISRDITNYKNSLAELKENEARLEAAQVYAKMGYWELVEDQEEALWSSQMYTIFGLDSDVKSGPETLCAVMHKGDLPNFYSSIKACFETGHEHNIEYRITRPSDGDQRWIQCRGKLVIQPAGLPNKITGFIQDITERKLAEIHDKTHNHVLELLTSDALLATILEAIVLGVEQENQNMLCSILLLDDEGTHLLNGAAPSLPNFYNDATEGMGIGVGEGSCGTAAFTNERVIVDDIQNHPYWGKFKDAAGKAGLASCWSEPIRSSNGKVLGTFAIYHRNKHHPTETNLALIEKTANLVSVAIEKFQTKLILKTSEERYALAMKGTQDGLWDWNLLTNEILFSERWKSMLGYTENEIKNEVSAWEQLMHPDDLAITLSSIKDFLSHKTKQYKVEFRMQHKEGNYINILSRAFSSEDKEGEITRLVGTHVDITERKLSEEKLKLAASVFTHAGESITITDDTGIILDINDTFTHITGFSREEAIGKNSRILQSGRQPTEFYAQMWQVLVKEGYWSGELWNRRKNGEVYAEMKTISAVRDEHGITTHYVALGNDITQIKKHQEQLERIAHYDLLTNLPNRVLLADRISQAMLHCQRHYNLLAVVFLDLDGFKAVNDAHGHDVGDEVLIALSVRMKNALREGDSLARIGGDEFVAVLTDLTTVEDCEPVLERLLLAASAPVIIDNIILNISASLGVTLYPKDNMDADQLMRHADQAMYVAKQSGKNRYHLFDTAQDDAIKVQRENLEAIRYALDNQQFILHYQPKVNMKTGEVVGVEALIRWQHPERGLLNPIEFLPVIENSPMMIEIGEWVIDCALTQISSWQKMGLHLPVSTSVNICAIQLQQTNFVDRLTTQLVAHPDVDPSYLELEVLETSALEDVHHVSTIMNACIALGVNFALDDFGTGYSSLTYLRRLPASLIKIDQTFVRDMLVDAEDLAIVEGVIALAKSFKRKVIAEGVETIEHGSALLNLGCELAQGYGIAKPMPASDIPIWIKGWKPDASWQV